ncbi:MAG: hypothetical protein QM684_22145 [Rhizobium sp.]
MAGLTPQDIAAMAPDALARVRERAAGALKAQGAHYIIDTVADLLPVIDDIERRLQAGERP